MYIYIYIGVLCACSCRHGFSQRRLSMLGSDGRRYFFLVQVRISTRLASPDDDDYDDDHHDHDYDYDYDDNDDDVLT